MVTVFVIANAAYASLRDGARASMPLSLGAGRGLRRTHFANLDVTLARAMKTAARTESGGCRLTARVGVF